MSGYRIYSINGLGGSACIYYRIALPLQTMDKLGFPCSIVLDDASATISPHQRAAMFMESDITLVYQNVSPQTINMMGATKKFKPMKASDGEMRWPPTYIVDTDDDLFNVMPLNITYGRLGTRRPDGKPLEKGDEVGIAHPTELAPPEAQTTLNEKYPNAAHGTIGSLNNSSGDILAKYIFDEDGQWHLYLSLWRDSGPEKNFDIEANKQLVDNWVQTIKHAHLVTCSTPRAAEYIRREVGPEIPTFVTYNAIDFNAYPKIDLRSHPDEVRILWEGSATHHEALWPITEAIGRVAKKYPQTKWVFFGAKYKWAYQNLPADQVDFVDWVTYDAYKLRLSTIGHDINLAPMAPHLFNQSRSAIRWYESSAIWKPAATIAQNTGAYHDEIEDGKTGLLFSTPEEFETKIGGLIEQKQLRKQLASNAKDWVRSNREAKDIATKLFQKYVEVREAHKQSIPREEETALVEAQ
jgi:glycosyltransferase involved in cell wall biosynthesis